MSTGKPVKPDVRVVTRAPVSTGTVVWQARGQLYVSVAVKATFGLVNDQPMELTEPAEMVRAELHHRDNPARSVRATSEVVPYLSRADVVLTGHACAPGGTRATMVAVRLAVIRDAPLLDKTLHVHGDRKGGEVVPFERIPLIYERALGGVGWDHNPLGSGLRAGGTPDTTAANILSPSDPGASAGFGPISRTWPARRRLLGKTDRKALDKPVVAVPEGFEWAYFQAAPPDQQIDFLRGDEWLLLEGIHPDVPRILSRLPGARVTGTAFGLGPGEPPRAFDFRADMLHVDADAQSCSVVWRSAIAVRDEASLAALSLNVELEIGGQSIEWSDGEIADIEVEEAPPSIDLSEYAPTLVRPEKRRAEAPLQGRPEKTTLWTAEMAAAIRTPPEGAPFDGTRALSLDDQERAGEKAAVPFADVVPGAPRPAAAMATPAAAHGAEPEERFTGTVALSAEEILAAVPAERHAGTLALTSDQASAAAKRPETPFGRAQHPGPRRFVAKPIPGAPWSPAAERRRPPLSRAPQRPGEAETIDLAPDEESFAASPQQQPRPQLHTLDAETMDFAPDEEPPAAAPPPRPRPQLHTLDPETIDVSPDEDSPASVQQPPPPLPAAPAMLYIPSLTPTPTPAPPSPAPATPPRSLPLPPVRSRPAAAKVPPLPPRTALPPRSTTPGVRSPEPVPPRSQDSIPVLQKTPFTVFTVPWQLKAGVDSIAVVVKATCDLVADGPAVVRKEADPPSGDLHEGGELTHTIVYPSDFAVFKPRADVLLAGHAYAPGGSSPAAQVRFRFGQRKNGFDRRIAVFGERRWQKAGIKLGPTEPRLFKKVPLLFERAFGGAAFEKNPVGIGQYGDLLPQLEDPESLLTSPGDTPDPACFAGISALWPERRSKLGTYDAPWKKTRWPYFPDDFDWAHCQAAPASQQLDHLLGDEPFELAGVSPDHPAISGKLPAIKPRCFAQKTTDAGAEFHEVVLRLDTVAFEPDAMKLTLVWRGLVDVRDAEASDVAELFVLDEPLAGPHVDRHEAFARYRAAKLPPADPEASVEGPPANDTSPEIVPIPGEAAALRARAVALFAAGEGLDGMDFGGADLSDLDLSGRSFKGAVLTRARLDRSKLHGASFEDAQLDRSNLAGADFTGADLTRADFTRADLTSAIFEGATLAEASFEHARCEGARFADARGDSTSFANAFLKKARFDRAALGSADFTRAELDGAVFDAAALPQIRLYDARGTGVSFKGATLDGARADGVSLKRCALQRVQAHSSVWDRACLDESSFLGAVLTDSGFVKASCRATVFSGADLTAARLRRGAFHGATFLKANLMTATLEGADLEGADLRGANLHGAETHRARLAGARVDLAIVTQTKLAEKT